MPLVKLPQKKLTLEAPLGANLMRFLLDNNIPVASSCLGDGICSKCRVKVKVPGPVYGSGVSDLERTTLQRNRCGTDERLSCQITIEIDLEVTTTYW